MQAMRTTNYKAIIDAIGDKKKGMDWGENNVNVNGSGINEDGSATVFHSGSVNILQTSTLISLASVVFSFAGSRG